MGIRLKSSYLVFVLIIFADKVRGPPAGHEVRRVPGPGDGGGQLLPREPGLGPAVLPHQSEVSIVIT